MPEIKSQVSEETLTKYARDNNLDVFNLGQWIVKIYELENYCKALEGKIYSLHTSNEKV